MLDKKHMVLRPAIAMIELIFAIVVIGITLLSAPLIIGQSVQSINTSLQQESIAAAGSQISLILSYAWDENDTTDIAGNGILRVVSPPSDPVFSFGIRDVNYTRAYNAAGTGFENASAVLGAENNDMDDIDDFNGLTQELALYSSESVNISNNEGEYLDQKIQMKNQVFYGTDVFNPTVAQLRVRFNNPFRSIITPSNIKLVSVTLTTQSPGAEQSKMISLSAFACNIGSSETVPRNTRILP
jgi:type II secretory pathway pseudopilin PulG